MAIALIRRSAAMNIAFRGFSHLSKWLCGMDDRNDLVTISQWGQSHRGIPSSKPVRARRDAAFANAGACIFRVHQNFAQSTCTRRLSPLGRRSSCAAASRTYGQSL